MAQPADRGAPLVQPAPAPVVGFVGSGKAATTLALSLKRRGYPIQVAERGSSAEALARRVEGALLPAPALAREAEVLILAVPDRELAGAAARLAALAGHRPGRVAVHLAGSLDREAIASLRAGGFAVAALHPLQVLSGWRIPPGTAFAVDADPDAEGVVNRLVDDLRGVRFAVPASARPAYHAAAVIAANLGMTLLAEAVDLGEAAGIERQQLLQGLTSLVRGGLEAATERGLPAALTGPVVRGDVDTVQRHLAALQGDPQLREAYRAVSSLLARQVARAGRTSATDVEAMTRLLVQG